MRQPLSVVKFQEVIAGTNVRIGLTRDNNWVLVSPDLPKLYMTGKSPESLRKEADFVIREYRALHD